MQTFKVYVIRPYHAGIRKKMATILSSIGGEIPGDWITQEDATDVEVVADLRAKKPDVILAPFHIGKDKHGDKVHGLLTIQKIIEAFPWASQVPVLMPLSVFGGGAFALVQPEFEEKHKILNEI